MNNRGNKEICRTTSTLLFASAQSFIDKGPVFASTCTRTYTTLVPWFQAKCFICAVKMFLLWNWLKKAKGICMKDKVDECCCWFESVFSWCQWESCCDKGLLGFSLTQMWLVDFPVLGLICFGEEFWHNDTSFVKGVQTTAETVIDVWGTWRNREHQGSTGRCLQPG